jgi:hypothetical protein
MNRSLDIGTVMRRVLDICVDQAPVLLPVAAVVFVLSAILTSLPIAFASAFTLVAVVIGLAWASSPG